jgi:uncharacterized protein DUF2846
MNKIFHFSLLVFLAAIVVSFKIPNSGISSKTADNAIVYIYRVGQFGAAGANWAIFEDEVKICKLSNNKFIKHEVKPGKHIYTAKVGGVSVFKKETEIEINAEAGQSYYIACNVKTSITRARLELIEVTKNSAEKQMAKMTLDKCQEDLDSGN